MFKPGRGEGVSLDSGAILAQAPRIDTMRLITRAGIILPLALIGLALGLAAGAAADRDAAGVASPRTAAAAAEDTDGSLRGPRVVVVRELLAPPAGRILQEEPVTIPRRLPPAGFRTGAGLREPARANAAIPPRGRRRSREPLSRSPASALKAWITMTTCPLLASRLRRPIRS